LIWATDAQLSPKAYDLAYFAINPHTFASYLAGYNDLWSRMAVTKVAEATKQVRLIAKYADVYKRVEAATGVPWLVVGLLHLREAGPQDVGKWKGILHNGQAIVGTGRKSTIVPKGVGPFATWHEAAVDAIKREGLDKLDWSKDGPALTAYVSETFNGFGYRQHGIPSPYLWGGSTVQKRGKYVADGKYDASTMDPQIGTMTLLKVAMQITGFTFDGTHAAPTNTSPGPVAAPPAAPAPATPKPPLSTRVDPQRQVGGLLNSIFKVVQSFLKRKS
jgi:lysozyme family protein